MIRFAAAASLVLLAGCGGKVQSASTPIIVPQQVLVPVTGACVPATLPPAPTYPDSREALLAAKDPAERYQLLGAGWPLRNQRLTELEIVVAGCPKAEK